MALKQTRFSPEAALNGNLLFAMHCRLHDSQKAAIDLRDSFAVFLRFRVTSRAVLSRLKDILVGDLPMTHVP
jgi:hypothetical protein